MIGRHHVCELLIEAAASTPGQTAYHWPQGSQTWAEFERDVRAVAASLQALDIQRGDTVAVLLPDLPLHPILAFAIPMIGAAYLPLSPRRSLDDLARLLQRPAPSLVFIAEYHRPQLEQKLQEHDLALRLIGVREDGLITSDDWPREEGFYEDGCIGGLDDVAVKRLSPGVSRDVQVVPLRHRELLAATEAVRKALQVLPTDTLLGAFPYSNAFGYLTQILLPAWTGACVRILGEVDPETVIETLETGEITAFMGGAKQFGALRPALQQRLAQRAEARAAAEAELPGPDEAPATDAEESDEENPASDDTEQSSSSGDDTSDNPPSEDPSVSNPAEQVPSSGLVSGAEEPESDSEEADDEADDETLQLTHRRKSTDRHLRFAICAGAHADEAVLREFAETMGCPVATAYGVVEACGLIAINPAHVDDSHPESVGKPVSGMAVMIRDDQRRELSPGRVGDIWIKGTHLFQGYEDGSGDSFCEDGWFHTSDIGSLNEQHWLYFLCRKEDCIDRGGFPVVPQEVEAVLNSSRFVAESAVVGTPDPSMGQRVIAFVVPEPNADLEDSRLQAHCAESLPQYKIPARFIRVDELPRSPNGFILRRELRERAVRGG